jgi:hypothetical protein
VNRRDEIQRWVITHAKTLKEKYFNEISKTNTELNQLTTLALQLKQSVESSNYDEKLISSILQDIATLLVKGQGISTYEFLRSQLCSSLLHFFTFLSSNGN